MLDLNTSCQDLFVLEVFPTDVKQGLTIVDCVDAGEVLDVVFFWDLAVLVGYLLVTAVTFFKDLVFLIGSSLGGSIEMEGV